MIGLLEIVRFSFWIFDAISRTCIWLSYQRARDLPLNWRKARLNLDKTRAFGLSTEMTLTLLSSLSFIQQGYTWLKLSEFCSSKSH